ncbi:hypothetical protein DAEQUDRAFT_721530 [Daedalea quercina L-15889]|uniref:Uncharacterized protein n=1 Tax=Daedalea quercina L-15889 TaxID=1314783 RepID=A0A165TI31_9APHY|nr:hypothetical protein DAEQUDRAFT_721530 [Daedalea quercina L-15889]
MRLGSALSILLASLAVSVSALPLGSRSMNALEARAPGSLNEAEVMARAFADAVLDARELLDAHWLEARTQPGDEPPKYSYSVHDPINGAKPKYTAKDPNPPPKYSKKDPQKKWWKPKGSSKRAFEDVEELEARTQPGDEPPKYSPKYSAKDPHPPPKYSKKDPQNKWWKPKKSSKRAFEDVEELEARFA